MKIGIVGLGWVGTSVAISSLHRGVAQELLLNDLRPGLAESEAMDLSHGSPFYPSAQVRAAALEEMASTDAVVIAAGRGGTADEDRLALLADNVSIARRIAGGLRDYKGLVVVVTNPVDVLTRVVTEHSGLPANRVLGTGTMLDTARLRDLLGAEMGVDPRSVHAQVVGEHGDSEVVLWSGARVGGRSLRDWPAFDTSREPALATTVRRAAYEIIQRKGATNHAIGLVTAHLLDSAFRDSRRVLTVSRVHDRVGEVDNVALSLPTVVSRDGGISVVEPDMDRPEREALARSASVLERAYQDATGASKA